VSFTDHGASGTESNPPLYICANCFIDDACITMCVYNFVLCVAMPAAVTWPVCYVALARPWAYRRHHCLGRPSMTTAALPVAQIASGDRQWELDDLAHVQLVPLSPATPPRPTTRTSAESYLGTPILTSPGPLPSPPGQRPTQLWLPFLCDASRIGQSLVRCSGTPAIWHL